MNDYKGDKPRLVEATAPKEIDRPDVLGELEHRFRTVTDDLPVIGRVLDELVELDILRYREWADDPSKDPIGTLRREAHDDALVIYMKTTTDANGWWTAVYSNAAGIIGKRFDNQFVAEFPIFGSCPGTPAAEADPMSMIRDIMQAQRRIGEPPEEWQARLVHDGHIHVAQDPKPNLSGSDVSHVGTVGDCKHEWCQPREAATADPLSLPDRQRVAELVVAGDLVAAYNVAATRGAMPLHEARGYVEGLPEYQTFLNHRKVEDVELPDLWVGGAAEAEPPAHVFRASDRDGHCLARDGENWMGEGGDGYPLTAKPWRQHAARKYAPYTEVRP